MDHTIIIYFLKVSASIIFFYGFYILFLKNDTFNHVKRFYLLFVILFSLTFPFWNINIFGQSTTAFYQTWLPEIEVVNTQNTQIEQVQTIKNNSKVDFMKIFFYTLGLGTILLLIKMIVQVLSILKLRFKNDQYLAGSCEITDLSKDVAPFSFFKWIFISKDAYTSTERETMIAHEKIHANQYHSLDVLLYELFCAVFWWNPFSWLLKKEVRINLEYIADQCVIKKGFEPKQYQYLLLQITSSNAGIQIVNNFNVSQLKKRIIMINKQKSKNQKTMKYLIVIPVILFMLSANSSCSKKNNTDNNTQVEITKPDQENTQVAEVPEGNNTEVATIEETITETSEKPFTVVDEMPQFPGGDKELMKFIGENLKYPINAVEKKIEGRVVARFVVSSTGQISSVTVIRSLDPDCDNEAVRVLKSMPKWQPGKQDGIAVPVYYTIPILFRLS